MKLLNLLVWVGQFGLSIIFPLLFFLLLASWLQERFGFGNWIVIICGILGLLTTVSTARSCLRALRRAAEEFSQDRKDPPVSFNDHQ